MDQTPATAPQGTTADLEKHPLLLGDLFRLAWSQFVKNWKDIVLLTVAISLPLNLLAAIFSRQVASTNANPSVIEGIATAGNGISILLLSLLGILIPMGITVILRGSLVGKQVGYQEALRTAFNRWTAGIATSLLMAVCLIGLAILLVVPAIYFGVLWAFAMYIIIEEKLSGMAALKASREIVRGRWWKVLGNTLAFAIVAGIVTSIVSMPFRGGNVISVAIVNTIGSIGTSFSLVGGYLLYRNLKANKATNA
jgi:hypothetical protein